MSNLLTRIDDYASRLQAGLPKRFQLGAGLAAKTGRSVYAFLAAGEFRRAVEFGSGFGISSAYTAAALKEPAVLYVLESNTERAAVAEKALSRLLPPATFFEIIPGLPTHTADTVLRNLQPVDYVGIAGEERYEPFMALFASALAVMRSGGVISGYFRGEPALRDALAAIRDCGRIQKEIKIGDRIGFEVK